MDLTRFRRSFDILRTDVWLATPSSAPAATRVVDAVSAALQQWSGGRGTWRDRDGAAQRTRGHVAALLNAAPADVALVQSVAQAAATVARSLPAGSRVVVGEQEYRSNLFPWLATERTGVEIATVAMPRMSLRTERLLDAITPQTTLVALSTVQSASGSRVDLRAVSDRCRDVGAKLFLDATQSLGVLRLPPDVDPDFVAVHGYKWLLAPRGAAWLYVKAKHLAGLDPLAPSHRSAEAVWDDFYGGPLTYADTAARLDMSLGFLAWAGAETALELIGSLDPDEVENHCLGLADYARTSMTKLGLSCVASDEPSHIVSVRMPDTGRTLAALEDAGIHATARAGLLRLGCHAFNVPADIDAAVDVIRKTST